MQCLPCVLPGLLIPRVTLALWVEVLGPCIERVEVHMRWREVARDVCTNLPGTDFPDFPKRAAVKVREVLSRLDTDIVCIRFYAMPSTPFLPRPFPLSFSHCVALCPLSPHEWHLYGKLSGSCCHLFPVLLLPEILPATLPSLPVPLPLDLPLAYPTA